MTGAERPEDVGFMRRALDLAERGWGRVSPNPLVGAVVVRDGVVVGEGWHTEYGAPHAEVEALHMAGEAARASTVYVTLEPCSHHGKTPPCTDALRQAGVGRVVYACADPNPAAEGGARRLAALGIEVTAGVEEQSARDLNARFFHRFGSEADARPWMELKLALSLDARVADLEARSGWITGEAARAEVHRLRAHHDAVLVGIGTALADDPLLTVRGEPAPRLSPVRVVLDRRLRLRPDSRLARSAAETPVWVVSAPDAPDVANRRLREAGVRVLVADGLRDALRVLRGEGLQSVFCEGGAALASAILNEKLADRLALFYAPLFLGPAAVSPFAELGSPRISQVSRWRRVRTVAFADDTLIELAR